MEFTILLAGGQAVGYEVRVGRLTPSLPRGPRACSGRRTARSRGLTRRAFRAAPCAAARVAGGSEDRRNRRTGETGETGETGGPEDRRNRRTEEAVGEMVRRVRSVRRAVGEFRDACDAV